MTGNARAVLNEKDHCIIVTGVINFETAATLWNDSILRLQKCSEITIDLSQVISANSAGLALLLEWRKWGTVTKKKVTIINIPESLQSIAKVAGVQFD